MGSSVTWSQEQWREVGCQTDWQLSPVEEYIPVLVGGPGQGGHGDPPVLGARMLVSQKAMLDQENSMPALGPFTEDNSSEVMGLLRTGAVPNSDTESDLEEVQDRAKKDIMKELNFFCDENNMGINAWNDFNFEDPLKDFDMNQLSEPSAKVSAVGEAIEKKEMKSEGIVNSSEADVDPQITVKPSVICQTGEAVPEGETIESIANFICQSRESSQAEENTANPTRGEISLGATISTSKGSVPVLTGVPVRRLATETISISRLLPIYSLPRIPRALSKLSAGGVTSNSQPIVISSSESEEEAFFIKGLPRGKKSMAVSGGRYHAGLQKKTFKKTPLPRKTALPSPPGTVRRLLPVCSQTGVSWGLRRPASPLPCASPQHFSASPLAVDLGSVGGLKRAADGSARELGPKAKSSRGFRDLIE